MAEWIVDYSINGHIGVSADDELGARAVVDGLTDPELIERGVTEETRVLSVTEVPR